MINFNSFFCLTCWARPTNVTLVKSFFYYKRFLPAGIILVNPCLMCDRMAIIYECFAYANTLYASIRYEWVTYVCIHFFLQAKTLFMFAYSQHDYTWCVHHRGWCINWPWIFIPILIWKFSIRFLEVLLVFDS